MHAGEPALRGLGAPAVTAEEIRDGRQPGKSEDHRYRYHRRLEMLDGGTQRWQREERLEIVRDGDEAADGGAEREDREHDGHRRRRLVHVVRRVRVHSRRAEEREPQEPEHVERGQERREARRGEQPGRAAALAREREPQDLVLREEARERRDAGDRGGRDRECRERDRDAAGEAAHLPQVLLAAQRVDDAARAEEQAGLEEGVRV